MAETGVTFPRISTRLVMPGAWVTDGEWYRFFEALWKRTGGDEADFIDENASEAADLQTQISAVKAYTLSGTEILINGLTSRQLFNQPLAFSLAITGVTAGTYGTSGKRVTFTVDSKGRLTAAGDANIDADEITFDPMGSGLVSTNVGDALREIAGLLP